MSSHPSGTVETTRRFARKLHRRYALFTLGVVLFIGLLAVLEQRLTGRAWVMGDDLTIADIAIFPWVRNLVGFYGAGDLVGIQDFTQVRRALDAFVARPAVIRGLAIPDRS